MAELDKKDLPKSKEEIEKLVKEIILHFIKLRGYNLSNDAFTLGHDAKGSPTLKHKTNFKITELPEGWKYGVYYLDAAYPRVGIWNEEGVFIPTESELDKSQVATYRDADDLANMIKAANERVSGANVTFPGNNTIRIDGVDKIDLPTADLVMRKNSYGETVIISTLNPEIEFRVEIVRSAEQNNENASFRSDGEGYGVGGDTTIAKDAYDGMEDDGRDGNNKGALRNFDIDKVNYNNMRYCEEHYQMAEDGKIVRKAKLGDNQSLDVHQITEDVNYIRAMLIINNYWKKAYQWGKGGDSRQEHALDEQSNAEMFDRAMTGVRISMQELHVDRFSEIAKNLYNSDKIADKEFCRALIKFLHTPEIATMYGIIRDETPEEVIENALAEKRRLAMQAMRGAVSGFATAENSSNIEDSEAEDENEFVLTRHGPHN